MHLQRAAHVTRVEKRHPEVHVPSCDMPGQVRSLADFDALLDVVEPAEITRITRDVPIEFRAKVLMSSASNASATASASRPTRIESAERPVTIRYLARWAFA